jgi:16S rRNA (cytidine1402-2'-O)-methyltransferase
MSKHGRLVLVATPIGNLGDLSPRAVAELRDADVIAAEDTRRTRALLSHAGIAAGRRLRAVHAHNERQRAAELVEEIRRGRKVVFATDAGTPGISDPGERLVRVCLEEGLAVEAVPGPSAVLAALVLSGLPTGRFVFEGFLPRKGRERAARLEALATERRTAVCFEAPHRLAATVTELAAACGPERPVAIARELTKVYEEVWRGSLRAAVEHYAATEPRGEQVIVLGGAPEEAVAVDDETVVAALRGAMELGASARDAAAHVSTALRIPKRRAYQLAVQLREDA